jgi:CRP/FNR family transcriptional regulator, dissimilatory nitrate respiration regulator
MPAASDSLPTLRRTALIGTLRQSRMFSDLSSENLEAVAAVCSLKSLEKGQMLFREGDKAEGFYVLQTGAISVFKITPDGREQIICVFRPPDSFAEVTLATLEAYPANAVALENSKIVLVQRAGFRDLIRRNPELSLHMLASMSLHLKHLVQTLQDYKGRQIEGRLADWLLRHAPEGAVSFELPVTKKNLAGQLGVTSETLSRTFARFRDEGLIRVEGPRMHLLNTAGLRAYIDPEL